MKAVVYTKYGSPEFLQIRELPKPVPEDYQVLIRVYSATVHIGDTRIRRADPFLIRLVFGLFKPKKNFIPGLEVAGIVEAVGKDVQKLKAGDRVFALTGFIMGGNAECICLPAKKKGSCEKNGLIASMPCNLSFEEAAVVPAGGLTALKNIQKAGIHQGMKILINGASGSLGTYAIQLAVYFKAHVTAVCSGKNSELVRSLGAQKVIDYTKEDFTACQEHFDIVYDAVMKSSPGKCKKLLKKKGVFVNNNSLSPVEESDLLFLKDLIENNRLKPVLDKIYPMEEISAAHKYVDQGHKMGNVALTITDS